jgi:hypothetical protein
MLSYAQILELASDLSQNLSVELGRGIPLKRSLPMHTSLFNCPSRPWPLMVPQAVRRTWPSVKSENPEGLTSDTVWLQCLISPAGLGDALRAGHGRLNVFSDYSIRIGR